MSRSDSVPGLQKRAWGFYGWPGSDNRAVGEVHYVNEWLASQMTRLDWDIFIGGNPSWSVELPDKTTISTTRPAEGDTPTEQDQTEASGQLLDQIDWDDTNVRAVTTNLFVAGQGDYMQPDDTDRWRVVSVVEKDRKKTLDAAKTRVPFLWPHPADVSMPDAPLFSVLEVLEELDWLNRQARAQSRQRVLINGVIVTDDGFDKPGEASFWDQWNNNLSAKMVNPDDMSPIRVSGPTGIIKDGVQWVIPPFGYDDVLDRRVLAAINRLAYGLPVPPEILLGMQAQSRATAFQVEENAYRAHIEPLALLVAQVAQDALNEILDQEVEVVPNAARLLGRRNSVQDVKDAYDRKLVTAGYVREVLGIPEDEAPQDAEQSQAVVLALDLVKTAPSLAQDPGIDVLAKQIASLLQGSDTPGLNDAVAAAPKDPANVAADEPVTAAATTDLSALLSDIDFHLSSELAGFTAAATDRARQRLGAAARVNPDVRSNKEYKGFKNGLLAVHLGVEGLTLAGVDIAAQITEPLESASEWWGRRVQEAWKQTATLIPGWSGQTDWVTASSDLLVQALTTHVVETLDSQTAPPLEAEQIRNVVNAAAGGGV